MPHRGVAEVYGAGASLAGREEIAAMAAEVAEQDPSQQVAAAQVCHAGALHGCKCLSMTFAMAHAVCKENNSVPEGIEESSDVAITATPEMNCFLEQRCIGLSGVALTLLAADAC